MSPSEFDDRKRAGWFAGCPALSQPFPVRWRSSNMPISHTGKAFCQECQGLLTDSERRRNPADVVSPRPSTSAKPSFVGPAYGLLRRKNKLPVGGVMVMLFVPLLVVMV